MLPFEGLPYGTAPVWCFPLIEFSIYALLIWCFLDARKRSPGALAYLTGGLIFGLLLELFEVLSHSYSYGRFWLMVGRMPMDVPMWIGCAWAVIMYTARLFSDALRLPLFAAAALDTLLALNIDLSIDVVAYRLHMWHWDWTGTGLNPLTAQWFGIPYGNFIGWATVVFCYSTFSRLLERPLAARDRNSIPRAAFIALLAILCSLGVLIFDETILAPFEHRLGITSAMRLLLIVAVLIALTIAGWGRRQPSGAPAPALAQWAPGWFHIFFMSCFFGLGLYRENSWMTAAACVNILLGIAIHLYPAKLRIVRLSPYQPQL